MQEPFLLSRLLLRFQTDAKDIQGDLSAVTRTEDGHLWLGSDELRSIERVSPVEPMVYGNHKSFPIGDFIELFNDEDEIDIEGMDVADGYIWFTGSHSAKRKKPKGKTEAKDLERLTQLEREANRYILGRIPVFEGELLKSYTSPQSGAVLTAGCLQKTADESHNVLIQALTTDRHLGMFASSLLPSKENGIDIEGMAVRNSRVFVGMRGPVLRGWALMLDIEVEEKTTGVLTLKEVEDGKLYRKHFLDVNGLGVRDLCWHGDDLLILAGPTMTLGGSIQVFRLKNALKLSDDSISSQDSGDLEPVFALPFRRFDDFAEGIALFPLFGQPDRLLTVYDAPNPARLPSETEIFADVFQLP